MAIIKGGLGGAGKHTDYMIRHLTRMDQNDRIEILEIDQSLPSPTVEAALREWQAITAMTRSEKSFYEASINPKEGEMLTHEQWIRAADILEETLGFTGQPRFIVLHDKKGREHIHVLWQSVIVDQEKIVSDGFNYQNHERAQIAIEKEFGLSPSPRRFFPRETKEQPKIDMSYTREEQQKADRSGIHPKQQKELIAKLFQNAENWPEFNKALEMEGYYLAKGDKSGIFVIVDPGLEVHPLKSCIPKSTASAKEIKQFFLPLKPNDLAKASEVIACLKSPDHATNEVRLIEKHYADKKAIEQTAYKSASDRLTAFHCLKNEAVARSRSSKPPSGLVHFIRNILGLNQLKSWLCDREDRQRENEHRIERDRLYFDHREKLAGLEREKRRALHDLDEVYRVNAGGQPRFTITKNETCLNKVIDCLESLAEFDQNNTYLVWQEEARKSQVKVVTNYEQKQRKLEALKAKAIHEFAALYKDGDTAFEKFEYAVQQNGLRDAKKVIKKYPAQIGELTGDLSPEIGVKQCLEHYTKVEKLRDRLKIDQNEYLFAKHACERFPYRKLTYMTEPDEARLPLMRYLWEAAKRLSDEQWQSLNQDQQREISLARQVFRDSEIQKRAGESHQISDQYISPIDKP